MHGCAGSLQEHGGRGHIRHLQMDAQQRASPQRLAILVLAHSKVAVRAALPHPLLVIVVLADHLSHAAPNLSACLSHCHAECRAATTHMACSAKRHPWQPRSSSRLTCHRLQAGACSKGRELLQAHLNIVGDQVHGVEANAKLADEVDVVALLHLLQERCTRGRHAHWAGAGVALLSFMQAAPTLC